jgi:hypothetical protein
MGKYNPNIMNYLIHLISCVLIGTVMLSSVSAEPTSSTSATANIGIINIPPVIDSGSYGMDIETMQKDIVYRYSKDGGVSSNLLRSDAKIPYIYTGECLKFKVDVSDDNGKSDLESGNVEFTLIKADNSDKIVINAKYEPKTDANATTLTFYTNWNVIDNAYGLYNITIKAKDNHNMCANNGTSIYMGQIFLNPMMEVNITENGNGSPKAFKCITFGNAKPGTKNVPANENPISVQNIDPDNVGMKLEITASATIMENSEDEGVIPTNKLKIKVMTANGKPTDKVIGFDSDKVLVWNSLKPGMDNALKMKILLDVPLPLPSGSYKSTITIYASGL